VDNFAEKLSNYMVEPPGLYRRRGDHPGSGKMKKRILPEDVSINVGPDDPVPICNLPGHNWKTVLNNTYSTWLAMYKEDKSTKYVFLAGNSKFKGKNDLKKYEKARKLKSLITKIREDYFAQMNSKDPERQQLGVATYLIDILALRVGNEKGDDEADTVGCCSLRVEHIQLNPEDSDNVNNVTFDFLGKDSMRYLNTVELDPTVVALMRRFMRGKNKEDDLFDLINAGRLNDYLKSIYSHLSAKVFRTYNASFTLQKQLDSCPLKESDPVDRKVEFYDDANRKVAILCNHQKAVSKGFNAQSITLNQQLKEMLKYLEELKEHLQSFKGKVKKASKKTESAKKNEEEADDEAQKSKLKRVFPDNFEKTSKVIKSLEQKISKLEKKITSRDENKEIALNTSKLNYMDPRITVGWCKDREVPIEKVFPKSVREKFPWAMYSNPDFKF